MVNIVLFSGIRLIKLTFNEKTIKKHEKINLIRELIIIYIIKYISNIIVNLNETYYHVMGTSYLSLKYPLNAT